jgi:hypothetical protein
LGLLRPLNSSLRANIRESDLVPLINEQGEKEKADMNSLGVVLSPEGLAGTERNGAKASEARRSPVQRQPKWAPMRSLAHGQTQK